MVSSWLLTACLNSGDRPGGGPEDVLPCPTLHAVIGRDVRYVCDGVASLSAGTRFRVGSLLGRPNAAPEGARVEAYHRGDLVGRTQALPGGTFLLDVVIPEDRVRRGRALRVEVRVDGRAPREVTLRSGGPLFVYQLTDEGQLIPEPPIAHDGMIEMPLDYAGVPGGEVFVLNARTGAYRELSDPGGIIEVSIEGEPRDEIVALVRQPGGTLGGCYASVVGGTAEHWRPRCFCTSDERQRGECETPDDFPGVVRVTVDSPADAGVPLGPDASFE